MTAPTPNESKNHPLHKPTVKALRKVFDPEIPVNVYDLGLIYDLNIADDNKVTIRMTLTAPACPVADLIVQQVRDAAKAVEGVSDATVDLVFDPPWSPERMSEAALLTLNIDDPSQYRPPAGEKVFGINPNIRR
ncbi:MAG: SUF system Fe-S cluster assembly protein [Phycisphaerae bacterium]|nr:MAG: SUF system Fe-S cluster assembly protein [Phycisphaerae bacterium]